MPREKTPQNSRLATWPERKRYYLRTPLESTNLGHDICPAHQEVVNLVVNPINLTAQIVERLVLGHA
jgi:hypothetical protein